MVRTNQFVIHALPPNIATRAMILRKISTSGQPLLHAREMGNDEEASSLQPMALATTWYGASRRLGWFSIGRRLASRQLGDRKSTRLNSSHGYISYAVFCLKKKKQ